MNELIIQIRGYVQKQQRTWRSRREYTHGEYIKNQLRVNNFSLQGLHSQESLVIHIYSNSRGYRCRRSVPFVIIFTSLQKAVSFEF